MALVWSFALVWSLARARLVSTNELEVPSKETVFDIGPGTEHEYFDIGPYQVSAHPKVWVFDDMLPDDVLVAVNESFADKTDYGSWAIPKASNKLMDTLQSLAHVTHPLVYQDMMYVAEYSPGHYQGAHMDRYSISNYPDELLETVNVSRLALIDEVNDFGEPAGDSAIPLFSFVVNFSNVGSCKFVGVEPNVEVPAKEGRIVMWQNYHEDGSLDNAAMHHGTYPPIGHGKRILAAGAVADPRSPPNLRSNVPARGWLHFPLENHAGNGPDYEKKVGLRIY